MNILFISKHFSPMVGGSIRWYEETYSRFPNRIFVLAPTCPGSDDYDNNCQFKMFRTSPWNAIGIHPKNWRFYYSLYKRAAKIARIYRINVIHCDQVLAAGFIGYLISMRFSIPCYIYAHGEEISQCERLFPEKYVARLIYRKISGIIANSFYTRHRLLNFRVQKNKIRVVHPGVDTIHFKPGLSTKYWRRRLNLDGKRVLLTVSRLDERKGHDRIIQILPNLLKSIPNLIYLIAGKGEQEDTLKELAHKYQVADKVHFLGYVEDHLLPSLYNCADLFILPNRKTETNDVEGFGIVFLEANACGLPVIAGRSGGTNDSVINDQTGMLVDGTDCKQIARAILMLLNDKELCKNLGENGRLRAINEFSWDASYLKISKLMGARDVETTEKNVP
jgi:phosphatidylinositol alpha-1,6-mannosyltransferase